MRSVNCNITLPQGAFVNAILTPDNAGDPPQLIAGSVSEPGRLRFMLADDAPTGGGSIQVWVPGMATWGPEHTLMDGEGPTIELVKGQPVPFGSSLPAIPTRAQACALKTSFQGLWVQTQQYGLLPWFDPAVSCLTADDRQAVYAAKHTAGDTHQILGFSSFARSLYNEYGQPYQQMIAPNDEANTGAFVDLVLEIIRAGFIPTITFDGDNGDAEKDGYPNALRQLPILIPLLQTAHEQDLTPYVLFARFYDGVFYGSTPANIQNFGKAFRALLSNGHLAIEHQPGRIPVGNGPADYAPGGMMSDYDTICAEMDWLPHDDATWQVAARMLGPKYVRPPDQPVWDDPNPPWYLRTGSSRGPYIPIAFEYGTYGWVRSWYTSAQVQVQRDYLTAMGYAVVC